MEERKHISKIGRKPKHKRQMIYYSFQLKYLWWSAGTQVLFWQSIEEDKRVSAERYTGMRSQGVFGSMGRQRRCWYLSSQVGISGKAGGRVLQPLEFMWKAILPKGFQLFS